MFLWLHVSLCCNTSVISSASIERPPSLSKCLKAVASLSRYNKFLSLTAPSINLDILSSPSPDTSIHEKSNLASSLLNYLEQKVLKP